MAYFTRQQVYVAGAKLFASQLNAAFDHLQDGLKGTDLRNIKVKYNAGDLPTMELWNSGGNVIEFKVGGGETLKLLVNSSGQLDSSVSTGAPPFIVASTTVVTNLNADLLDGKTLTDFIRVTVNNQVVDITSATADFTFRVLGQGVNGGEFHVEFDLQDGSNNPDAKWRFNMLGTDVFRLEQWDDGTSSWIKAFEADINGASPYYKVWDERTAALAQVATTKSRTVAQIGVFYEGVVSTGAKQADFISSDDSDTLLFTKVKYSYRGGTTSGDTIVRIKNHDAAGTLQQTVDVTILQADAAATIKTVDITDIAVETNERITWTITQAGDHEDISVWLQGHQEIVTD